MNRNRLTFQAALFAIPLLYSPWGIAQSLSDACRDLAGFNDRGFIIRGTVPAEAMNACEEAIKAQPENTDLPAYLSRAYYSNNRKPEAYLPAKQSAEAGSAVGMAALGFVLNSGYGVDKDVVQAIFWYRKAAEKGNVRGQDNLGVMYDNGNGVEKDAVQAVYWYRKAAEQGYANAQNNLGVKYANGSGIEKDEAQAVYWYRKAAEQGDASAQDNLGVMYDNGNGIKKDFVQAVYWYRKAAEQDYANAQKNLGVKYANGNGVEKDAAQAVHWYRKAAEQGYANAQSNLGLMYDNGSGVEKDAIQAVLWYRKAAEQGYAYAQSNLGWMYANGSGVGKDAVQAIHWYRKAAEQGNANAQNHLGWMYVDGAGGLPANLAEARRLWELAAPSNDDALLALMIRTTIKEALILPERFKRTEPGRTVVKIRYLKQANLTPMAIRAAHTYLTSPSYQELDIEAKNKALSDLRSSLADLKVSGLVASDAEDLQVLAEAGVSEAADLLGQLFASDNGGGDDQRAVTWYRKAAEQGHAGGQYHLSMMYRLVASVEQAEWIRKSAEQGNIDAQRNLGWSYYTGNLIATIPVNKVQAAHWYRKAAEQGDATAQISLGEMYERGDGIEKDTTQALLWYRKAAETNRDALTKLHKLEASLAATVALPAPVKEVLRKKNPTATASQPAPAKDARASERSKAAQIDLQNRSARLSAEGKYAEAAKLQRELFALHIEADEADAAVATRLRELVLTDLHSVRRHGSPDNYFHLLYSSCQWGQAARAALDIKRPEFALFMAKRSVNLLQQARRELANLDIRTRECFLKVHEDRYRWLADLLVDMGRLGEAEQVLAMLKHFEVEEYLRSDSKHASASVEMALDKGDLSIQQTVDGFAAQTQAAATVQQLRGRTLTPDETKQLESARATLKQAGQRFNEGMASVVQDLRSLRQPGTEESAREGAVLAAASIRGALSKTFKGRAVVLQAVVLPHRMHWLFISGQTQQVVQIPVKREDLSRKVAAFRLAVQSPKIDPRPLARELYDLLLAPIEPLLRDMNVDTLMISADDVLRYLPFAALYDGKQYLIERFALSTYNPALRDMLVAQDQPDWKVAAFGVAEGGAGFSELPNIKNELRAVVRQQDAPDGALPGLARLDRQFTKTEFSKALDEHYPVIHVASHFGLAFGNRKNSVLLLGNGATLPLADLDDQTQFDFSSVELLTLSACETAVPVGQLSATGSEVDSLGSVIQKAGARSVLASLWKVEDSATAALMRSFYLLLAEKNKKGKANALQMAQLMLLTGKVAGADIGQLEGAGTSRAATVVGDRQSTAFAPDPNALYAHPFYWAPFILMGNWL